MAILFLFALIIFLSFSRIPVGVFGGWAFLPTSQLCHLDCFCRILCPGECSRFVVGECSRFGSEEVAAALVSVSQSEPQALLPYLQQGSIVFK